MTSGEWRKWYDSLPSFEAEQEDRLEECIADLAACERERDDWKAESDNFERMYEKAKARAEAAEKERDHFRAMTAGEAVRADVFEKSLKSAEAALRRIREYADHKDDCNKVHGFMPDNRCTCGLDAILEVK